MPLIPLTRGLSTIVDEEDYEWLSQFSWSAVLGRNGCHYASRAASLRRDDGTVRRFTRQMQRDILDPAMALPRSVKADHRNGDTLDNRRDNLRLADDSTSNVNRALFKSNTSGHRNVYLTGCGLYRVQVRAREKRYSGGYYTDFRAACEAADLLAKSLQGKEAFQR